MKKSLAAIILFMLVPYLSSCKEDEDDKSIIVMSITRAIDENLPGNEMCSSFVLTKENVVTYFSIAEEVDEYEFNQDAIIFPCKYEGTINIRSEQFHWEISAGGAGYLYRNKDVNKRYLCKKSCCKVLPNLC